MNPSTKAKLWRELTAGLLELSSDEDSLPEIRSACCSSPHGLGIALAFGMSWQQFSLHTEAHSGGQNHCLRPRESQCLFTTTVSRASLQANERRSDWLTSRIVPFLLLLQLTHQANWRKTLCHKKGNRKCSSVNVFQLTANFFSNDTILNQKCGRYKIDLFTLSYKMRHPLGNPFL